MKYDANVLVYLTIGLYIKLKQGPASLSWGASKKMQSLEYRRLYMYVCVCMALIGHSCKNELTTYFKRKTQPKQGKEVELGTINVLSKGVILVPHSVQAR